MPPYPQQCHQAGLLVVFKILHGQLILLIIPFWEKSDREPLLPFGGLTVREAREFQPQFQLERRKMMRGILMAMGGVFVPSRLWI
jgi:hypothetical protein